MGGLGCAFMVSGDLHVLIPLGLGAGLQGSRRRLKERSGSKRRPSSAIRNELG